MSEKPPSDDEKAKEIKRHMEEALRRVQNAPQRPNQDFSGKNSGSKASGPGPSKGRSFRHQGR